MASSPNSGKVGAVVYDEDSDLTVVFTFGAVKGGVWAYDVDEDSWFERSEIASPPDTEFSPALNSAIYDPVSGLLVTPGLKGKYATYDVDSDHWDTITLDTGDTRGGGEGLLIGYDPDTDQFIQWGAPMTLVNIRDRSLSFDKTRSPQLVFGWPPPPILTAQDPIRGLAIIHTLGGGELHAYDPSRPGWTVLYGESDFPTGPYDGVRAYDTMVYDTLNDRLVVIGGPVHRDGPTPTTSRHSTPQAAHGPNSYQHQTPIPEPQQGRAAAHGPYWTTPASVGERVRSPTVWGDSRWGQDR